MRNFDDVNSGIFEVGKLKTSSR